MGDESRINVSNDAIAKSGSSRSGMKIVIIVIIALVVLLGCCGGVIYFGYYATFYMSGQAVQPQIEGTPAINTYIGTIEEITLDWSRTSQPEIGNSDRLAFDVSGVKGSGLVIIQQGPQGLVPADWAILEIDGKSYIVFGTPPEDLGAEPVESETEEPTPDDAPTPAEETAEPDVGDGNSKGNGT